VGLGQCPQQVERLVLGWKEHIVQLDHQEIAEVIVATIVGDRRSVNLSVHVNIQNTAGI